MGKWWAHVNKQWTFGFHKIQGVSWLSEDVIVSSMCLLHADGCDIFENVSNGADCMMSATGEQWIESDRAEAVAACFIQCLENPPYAEESLENPEAVCVY